MSYLSTLKIGIGLAVFAGFISGCAYRFTNVAIQSPPDIRSIAIEAVYDTSRVVVPHELLWEAVQNEFARNGRILLTSRDQADALMTLHLTGAAVRPTGTPNTEAIDKDPPITDRGSLSPYNFKNLRIAGNYTTNEQVSFRVQVKVHHLLKRQVVFERSYNTSGTFRSIQPSTISQAKSGFLLYQEGLEARFRQLANRMSSKIVTDFFLSS